VPGSKVTSFETGTRGDYDTSVFLEALRAVQIRHNALEAARISATKLLEKRVTKGATFFLKILVYPHHVLRENALATGAGADRFQQGMRQSFGKPIGTAARVHAGQRVMAVHVNAAHLAVAKLALKRASHKLPTPCRIVVQ